MLTYVPVAGTHDWNPDEAGGRWWERDSAFATFMSRHDVERRGRAAFPFWSTALSGALFVGPARRAWWHGAYVLADYLEGLPFDERNVIALSHGGQVAAIAAGLVTGVHRLVTVGTPVRKDLARAYRRIRCPWMHLYSTGWENRWQVFGELFDRGVRRRWDMPAPALNRRVEGIGHGDLLRDPERFEDVYTGIILPFLRGPEPRGSGSA